MKVEIRPLVLEDAYTSFEWRNDKEVFKHTGSVYTTEITLQNELDWMNKILKEDNSCRRAIVVDETYIGNIYLTDILDDEAQFHIFIGDKLYWGKGISFLAGKLLIDYARVNLGVKSIYSFVKKINTPSIKLHLRLGFSIENEEEGVCYFKTQL